VRFEQLLHHPVVSLGLLGLALGHVNVVGAQVAPRLFTVLATAKVQSSPPKIVLSWPGDSKATRYQVSRKTLEGTDWDPIATLDGSATAFIDNEVLAGPKYEYQIVKSTSSTYTGYGYLAASIEGSLEDQRGKVLLIVANTYASDLAVELAQLEQDLVGDGWSVLRHDVSPADRVEHVKSLIQTEYQADPANTRAVFLFGAVPVPYSGDLSPDGHPNHRGAWPADLFYAQLTGAWTDSSVTNTNAERVRNWNIPGDGKFDQSFPPGEVDLELGRVDLSNMTCFANKPEARSEKDLLRQYLLKDHKFRHGLLEVNRRGLICDNFADKGDDPVAGSAWRSFGGFFGPESIVEAGWSNYFPSVTAESYLWSFASGGGQFYTCTGVGSSDDFALQDVRVVFSMWLGSYFADWDNESNFLRAPLGSAGYTLTSCYVGFPQWLFHPMAVGQTAGYCARLTQNNRPGGNYPPFNPGTNQVHIALFGDPTLRMHPVAPPTDLRLAATDADLTLTWAASRDPGVRGYHVYWSEASSGHYLRLTDVPVRGLSFPTALRPGTYMVRAIKLESTPSGTYWNASQGVFQSTDDAANGTVLPSLSITSNGGPDLELRVQSLPGSRMTLDRSADLKSWSAFLTNDPGSSLLQFQEPTSAARQRFFRARLVQ